MKKLTLLDEGSGQMAGKHRTAGKHRKARRRSKKFAMVGATTATATVLTVGMVSPMPEAEVNRDVMLTAATGPNYTQIITSSSNSFNNILFTAGNLGGAAAGIYNPLATAAGGLLPTFTAGTTQNDLTSLPGLLDAIAGAIDVGGVPGLPADATATILTGLVPGLGPVLVVLGAAGPALGALGTVSDVLTALSAIPLLDGVPTLGDLIGLTATQTTFSSDFAWPILMLGGNTTISNTFVQLPSLTASSLVTNILDGLNVAGQPISTVPGLPALVGAALAPLNGLVNTPSVTAFIPAASGNYTLPLGGSLGFLAAAPTLAVGPVAVGPVVLSDTDTVISIPIFAAGATLPLGLASAGIVTTPGVVFPTATGVSTLGGTTLTSFSIPLLGLGFTNLNVLSATYIGTNGINYNSGTNVAALITPFGPIPIVYSLGSFNIGTTGFGFTLPSLFTIGLLPPFQVGTAPTQQSPDGLIPASVLNLGLAVPTQTIDLVTLLGLPNPGDAVTPFLNPAFNTVVAPVGSVITEALNSFVGPTANGLASLTEQLTGLLALLSGGAAQAIGPASAAATPAAAFAEAPSSSSVVSGAPVEADDPQPPPASAAATPAAAFAEAPSSSSLVSGAPVEADAPDDPEPKKRPLMNVITGTANPGDETTFGNGRTPVQAEVTDPQVERNSAAESAQKTINDAVTNSVKAVSDAVGSVGSVGKHAKPDSEDGGGNEGD